jgi:hypothetical protein
MRMIRLQFPRRPGWIALGAALAVQMASVPLAGAASTAAPAPTAASPYFPLVPGSEYTYEGQSAVGKKLVPHKVVFTVTDLTKRIKGVDATLGFDQDVLSGQLTEAELAFFAIAPNADVRALGEYPEEYKNGKFVGAPSTWYVGHAGAKEGVLVPGAPKLGQPRFWQGLSRSIQFGDRGLVVDVAAHQCVPVGCYDGVVVVDEYNTFDKAGGHQRKYYAPQVGLIRIAPVGGDAEALNLTTIRHLCGAELDAARRAALRLDRRGYTASTVHAQLPHAKKTATAAC